MFWPIHKLYKMNRSQRYSASVVKMSCLLGIGDMCVCLKPPYPNLICIKQLARLEFPPIKSKWINQSRGCSVDREILWFREAYYLDVTLVGVVTWSRTMRSVYLLIHRLMLVECKSISLFSIRWCSLCCQCCF
jgi:hypothetical protein